MEQKSPYRIFDNNIQFLFTDNVQEVKEAFEPMKPGNEPSDPTIFGEPVVLSLLDHFFCTLDLKDNSTTTENILVPETDEEDVNEFNNNTIVAETDNEDQENQNLDQNVDMSPPLNPLPAEEQGNMTDGVALAYLQQALDQNLDQNLDKDAVAENLMRKSSDTEIVPPSVEEIEDKLLDFEDSGDEYQPPKDTSKDMFESSYTSASSVDSGT